MNSTDLILGGWLLWKRQPGTPEFESLWLLWLDALQAPYGWRFV